MNDVPLDMVPREEALRRYPEWADLYSGVDPATAWSLTPASTFNADEYNAATFNQNVAVTLPDEVLAKASQPRLMSQLTPDKFLVLPLPDAERVYTLRLFYALKPTRSATGMDEFMFHELEDAILHRTLQDMLVLPNVPWSDREAAAYHARQYVFTVNERRARGNIGNMRSSVQARMQPFG
jgi:hypothetical protein